MKNTAAFLIGTVLGAFFLGSSLAMPEGNEQKGRHLFVQECRPCHMVNPIGEEPAHYLGPDAKTQTEWIEVFENRQELPCREYWQDLSEQDLQDILTYLHCGASDSPTPEKCGKRSFFF
ncbi:MAG: cytochrome c [Desulfonatronovibrio sp.]